MNYIRKHALALIDDGEDIDGATARIFSNPPGEFGSLVNERVTGDKLSSSPPVSHPSPEP
jgi:magnesium chelatase subunit H